MLLVHEHEALAVMTFSNFGYINISQHLLELEHKIKIQLKTILNINKMKNEYHENLLVNWLYLYITENKQYSFMNIL